MLKNLLLTLGSAAMLAMPAYASVPAPAWPHGNAVDFSRAQRRGVRLTPRQIATIQAVQGRQTRDNRLPLGGNKLSRLARVQSALRKAPRRANASGSVLEGWRTAYDSEENGWYSLEENGTENLLWQYHGGIDEFTGEELAFPFNTGFIRDGKIYAIGSTMVLYWAMIEHGIFTRDGQIIDYTPATDFAEDFSGYIMSVAYNDNAHDEFAYAFTLNGDASGYMFQIFNPDTWEHESVRDDVPLKEVCLGMAFDTRNGKLIGITPENKIVSVDPATGEETVLREYPDLLPLSQTEAMTYSPYDNAFVFVRPDQYGEETELYYLDADTYELTDKANLYGTIQYPILITPNRQVEAAAPGIPTLSSLSFAGGALSGTAVVTLPTETFGKTALAGTVNLTAYVDGESYATLSGAPGQDVTVTYTDLAAGRHHFEFTPEQNGLTGPTVEANRFLGYDTPKAPENVRFIENAVSWDAVTATVNGGYLDTEALYYNVYIDGEKMNTEPVQATTLSVAIPEGKYATHTASVEAVNHDLTSALAYSNTLNYGDPFPLTARFTPTQKEAKLFTPISTSGNYWNKWGFVQGDNYFSVTTTAYEESYASDEYLYLPPLSVPATDNMIMVQYDVQTGDAHENLSICWGTDTVPDQMTELVRHDELDAAEFTTMKDYIVLPQADKLYLAFKTHKTRDGYQMALKHFMVKVSDIPLTAPAAPLNTAATPGAQGALTATVDFDMPMLDVAGNALNAATQLEATVTSPAGTVTATGLPGSHQSVEVATEQGYNDITVNAGGLDAKVRVYTGLDIPSALTVLNVAPAADNMSMTLNWQAPTTGVNGGYIDPSKVTYTLCLPDGEYGSWQTHDDLGTALSYTYTAPTDSLALYQVGILTSNQAGHLDIFRSTTQALGTPVQMPVEEVFSNYDFPVGPVYSEAPTDEYETQPGFSDLSYWDVENGSTSLVLNSVQGHERSYSRVVLPPISMEGATQPAIELTAYCAPDAGKLTLTAESFDTAEPVKVGEFQDKSEAKHMQRLRFLLPDEFKSKPWVSIKLTAEFEGEESMVAIGYIKVSNVHDADIALTDMTAPQFLLTGQSVNIAATVSNYGLKAQMIPALECEISNGERVLATLPMEAVDAPDLLEPLGKLSYKLAWNPDVEAGAGALTITVRAKVNDMDASNNEKSAECIISRGNQPLITDLKAEPAGDGSAQLTWSEPAIEDGAESFENYASFAYYNQLGDFTNIDADGQPCTYITAYDVPGANEPIAKGFQVFSQEEIDAIAKAVNRANDWCHPADGDKMLIAWAPYSVYIGEGLQADKWLVSPKVEAGSEFSFQAYPVFTGSEDIEIYTGTDADINSMTKLTAAHPFGDEWTKYTFTLPDGHTYFAVRYVGTSDGGTALAVDDFRYVKDGPAADRIVSYDIFRCGALMLEEQRCQGSFLDETAPAGNMYYNVRPVLQGENGLYRGQYSNTAFASVSGLESLASGRAVLGQKQSIAVRGYQGETLRVYDIAGRLVAEFTPTSDNAVIPASAGIYTVQAEGAPAAKVLVR